MSMNLSKDKPPVSSYMVTGDKKDLLVKDGNPLQSEEDKSCKDAEMALESVNA